MSSSSITHYINELQGAIANDDKENINILEKKLEKKFENVYSKIQFYKLPYENILRIIGNVDFSSIKDLFSVLAKTIDYFTTFYPDKSLFLLQFLKFENCTFSLNDYIQILINFKQIPIILSLKQFVEADAELPERDYLGEISALNQQIATFKKENENYKKLIETYEKETKDLNNKINDLNYKIKMADFDYIKQKLSFNRDSQIKEILNSKKFRDLKLWEKISLVGTNDSWLSFSDDELITKLGNLIQEAEKESGINAVLLLLDAIKWKNTRLKYPQFIYLFRFIKSSKFFVALNETFEPDLVYRDYEYELQIKDQEIQKLKRTIISLKK